MRKNFCAAPWASLSIDPDGQAKICCISKDRVPLTEFDQISSNSKFIEIRKSFIDDQQHPNCVDCWQREQSESEWESRRSTYQYDYFHDLKDPTQFQLEHLDLRWSNTCNLNCVYCGPTFSSKWAELQGQKQKFRVFPTVTDDHLSQLKILQMAGGEPMLIKENFEILERLLKVNPHVSIEVTTNLTQIENPIYNQLKKFQNVTFVVSFESTDRQFEYIRNGAVWLKFFKNLETLSQDFLHIQFNMVYFPLSSLNIITAAKIALDYTMSENIFVVSQSGGHGFDMLSQTAVQYIKQKNLQQIESLPKLLKQRFVDQIKLISTNEEQTFLPQYDQFDQLTNQNHKQIFTELYQ
jgi:organic radical activating enzyme